MKSALCKGRILNNHIWFCSIDEANSLKFDGDLLIFYGLPENKIDRKFYVMNNQSSLINNLLQSKEEIFSKIGKTVKYEINRSIKENLIFEKFNSLDLNNNDAIIKEFTSLYVEMYKSKNISTINPIKDIYSYIKNNMFILTRTRNDNQILAYHAYIVDEDKARLLYSCSNFRTDNFNKNLIGRANKFLHWCDICYFKDCSFSQYDWGGIFDYQNPNGIDKFKIEFGGKLITYYNYIVANSILGKIKVFMLKMKA